MADHLAEIPAADLIALWRGVADKSEDGPFVRLCLASAAALEQAQREQSAAAEIIADAEMQRLREENAALRRSVIGEGIRRPSTAPQVCPITGRQFFMVIDHPVHGLVPTYGGPYDSFTIPERDEDGFTCERYDHDEGVWVDGCESVGVRLIDDQRDDCEHGTVERLTRERDEARAALERERTARQEAQRDTDAARQERNAARVRGERDAYRTLRWRVDRAVLREREACAQVCRDKAMQLERKAQEIQQDEPDDAVSLRATCWTLSMCESDIRERGAAAQEASHG